MVLPSSSILSFSHFGAHIISLDVIQYHPDHHLRICSFSLHIAHGGEAGVTWKPNVTGVTFLFLKTTCCEGAQEAQEQESLGQPPSLKAQSFYGDHGETKTIVIVIVIVSPCRGASIKRATPCVALLASLEHCVVSAATGAHMLLVVRDISMQSLHVGLSVLNIRVPKWPIRFPK